MSGQVKNKPTKYERKCGWKDEQLDQKESEGSPPPKKKTKEKVEK